jgi:hypothetical protein
VVAASRSAAAPGRLHPAAVIPLARWGLPGSALVVGSVAPDLPAMLQIPALVHGTHTPLGVVSVDLAPAVAVFGVWQALYGPTVVAIAPRAVRARLPGQVLAGVAYHFGRVDRAARVVAAALLGVVTHVLWDGVTHDWTWGGGLLSLARVTPRPADGVAVGAAPQRRRRLGADCGVGRDVVADRTPASGCAGHAASVSGPGMAGDPGPCHGRLLLLAVRDSFYVAVTRAPGSASSASPSWPSGGWVPAAPRHHRRGDRGSATDAMRRSRGGRR